MSTLYDICGIGNAITDTLAKVDGTFLAKHGLVPGSMTLISTEQAAALRSEIQPEGETGGGSAANTCAVAAQFGARVAYLGKVAGDKAGHAFTSDLRGCGITFPSAPLDGRTSSNLPTACCIVLVTPDGQRTMCTYLGACTEFTTEDVLPDVIAASSIVYLEGYLFDPPHAQEAFRRAAALAHKAGRQVALSLSDPFCVGRHREAFLDLVRGHIDILFANEDEICALYQTEKFDVAAAHAARDTKFAALTRSEKGSVIICEGEKITIAPVPTQVVDTTGAGDAYAAGFLAGLTSGRTLAECGRLASVAASEIISHYGARPLSNPWKDMGF